MKNFIFFAIVLSFFKTSISEAQDSFWSRFRSELLIHAGATGYRTKKPEGTRRDDVTQIGYDIKIGNSFGDFTPFLTAHGHWAMKATHTNIGLGTFWIFQKSEFQFDFTRSREKLLRVTGDLFENDLVLYKTRAIWSYPIKQFPSFQLRSLLGFGNNTHGERKLFKFNRGEYYMAGVRFYSEDEYDPREVFICELYWEQDVIRSNTLRQERNSYIFKVGKRF